MTRSAPNGPILTIEPPLEARGKGGIIFLPAAGENFHDIYFFKGKTYYLESSNCSQNVEQRCKWDTKGEKNPGAPDGARNTLETTQNNSQIQKRSTMYVRIFEVEGGGGGRS